MIITCSYILWVKCNINIKILYLWKKIGEAGYSDVMGWAAIPFQQGQNYFFSPWYPDRLWAPPSLLSNRHQGLFPPEVTWSGYEADHSSPSSAEVKNIWSHTSIPPFIAWCLINYKQFYLLPWGNNTIYLLSLVEWDISFIILSSIYGIAQERRTASYTSWIYSTPSHSSSLWSILILSSHLWGAFQKFPVW
jgi:hypothetical protein